MDDRISHIFARHLAGESARAIAADLKISRARVYQLLKQARESGEFTASVQVTGISPSVNREHLALYLNRALASAGVSTRKEGQSFGPSLDNQDSNQHNSS